MNSKIETVKDLYQEQEYQAIKEQIESVLFGSLL